MSANKLRKAGQPIIPRPGSQLRLVPCPGESKRPEPDLELKEVLDDMRRRHRVQREPVERESDGKDAARHSKMRGDTVGR
jgi:hypothetical protein